MSDASPRAAVESFLRIQPNNQHSTSASGGMFDPGTVVVGAERPALGRCPIGVSVRDTAGVAWYVLGFTVEDAPGDWRLASADLARLDPWEPALWDGSLKFAYDFHEASGRAFDCVGIVVGRGADQIATVRLTMADERRFEERTHHGWAAFTIDEPVPAPVRVSLLDRAGELMWEGTSSAERIWRHRADRRQ